MNLYEYKQKYSLTLAELAHLCGIRGKHANSRMCRYVTGKRLPPGPVAKKIIDATNGLVNWNDFYDTPAKPEKKEGE